MTTTAITSAPTATTNNKTNKNMKTAPESAPSTKKSVKTPEKSAPQPKAHVISPLFAVTAKPLDSDGRQTLGFNIRRITRKAGLKINVRFNETGFVTLTLETGDAKTFKTTCETKLCASGTYTNNKAGVVFKFPVNNVVEPKAPKAEKSAKQTKTAETAPVKSGKTQPATKQTRKPAKSEQPATA